MKINNIYLGDSKKLIKNIKDNSVDLILTDPPYENYNDYLSVNPSKTKIIKSHNLNKGYDYEYFFKEFLRILKQPWILIFCSKNQISIYHQLIIKYNLKWEILIMHKTNVGMLMQKHLWHNKEYVIFIYKKWICDNLTIKETIIKSNTFNWNTSNKINLFKPWYMKHPTLKPNDILQHLILKFSDPDFIILDPFMGSASTLVNCIKYNRNYIGFEWNQEYFKMAEHRIKLAYQEKKQLEFKV